MRSKLFTLLTLCLTSIMLLSLLSCYRGENVDKRLHTLSDFSIIEIGMTYKKVVELMGEPTGSEGFGIVWAIYDLSDGSKIKLLFGSYNPEFTESYLSDIHVVDKNGRVYICTQSLSFPDK